VCRGQSKRRATRLARKATGPLRPSGAGRIGCIGERLATAAPLFSAPILKLAKDERPDPLRQRPVN
jgi:hypothetical protein